ncbi:hypothetical protein D9601_10880 [Sphingomonas sp. MA1305]|uniref:hypothetical protein n=1 Tax=unclassified Sphingomonas TaxID=196159 RepID=UPI0018DF34EC|nr:hypothetical protein [Sphingomonas sp. MA1305]MBI0475856.1 hypothetical protein [Sphingomonas sp. MA1305]
MMPAPQVALRTLPALETLPPLETLALRFAQMPREDAEALIDGYAAAAVGRWQLADATYWQRVKFRSRLLRAAAGPFPCSPLPRIGKA